MKELKIFDSTQEKSTPNNYLTLDRKYLHLYEINLKESFNTKLYDEFFDQLNNTQNIYSTVENLYLQTDLIDSIPRQIKKFEKLNQLTISGTRFWNLDLINVPQSVKVLSLIDHLNLHSNCLIGMDQLINLEEIYLEAETFYFDYLFFYESLKKNESDQMKFQSQIYQILKLSVLFLLLSN